MASDRRNTCDDTSTANGNVLDFKYSFDSDPGAGVANNGNVAKIENLRDTNRTQSFTYDELNRIRTAATQATSGTHAWGLTFGYDGWANLLSAAVTQGSAPQLAVAADQNNRIAGYCYDAAGNLLIEGPCGGALTYTYDAENRIVTTGGVTYTYDGDGKRVKKSNGKLYWTGMGSDPLAESDLSGNISEEYIFFNGKRVARRMVGTGAVFYYFGDHLGTSRVILQSGASTPCYDADYYPFGGERVVTDTCPQNYKFTGKERDAESNLDYFGARYYGSISARFGSSDPTMESAVPWNPQTWNRYTYVLNNPLALIDPDGELWVASGDKNDPYSWVDECAKGQTCFESVAATVGNDVRVYGSKDAKDITLYAANAAGVVDADAMSTHHDAQYQSIQTAGKEENFLGAQQAAALFNVAAAYHIAYPSDAKLVFTAGSAANGQPANDPATGQPLHKSHKNGANIDLRYMGSNGAPLKGTLAAAQANGARNLLIISLFKSQNAGLGSVLTGDPSKYGSRAASPKLQRQHQDHMHFQKR